MSKNTFNRIAWLYDGLAHIVFLGGIKRAQLHFLHAIKPQAKLLIIGGGTGWLLAEIDKLNRPMTIDYIEASDNMLEKSSARMPFKHIQVEFIHGTQDKLKKGVVYDVIITNFFLDVFAEENLSTVMRKLSKHLKNDGQWLMTDFVDNGKVWQKILLKTMYTFFRFTTNLEGSKLMDFSECFLLL